MSNKLATIVVLTYKKFQYFKECIDSVFMQNYSHIELIISDDGSENLDEEFIKTYIDKNKRENIKNVIINKHEKNVGTVKNFNDAIKKSQGEYIIPLAVDDAFYDENSVKNIVEGFCKQECSILTGYRAVYDNKLEASLGQKPEPKEIEAIKGKVSDLYITLCRESFLSGAGTSYSREFLDKIGLFDEEYLLSEDYATYLKASRLGYKFGFLDVPIIKYRLDGISTQATVHPLLDKDLKYAIKKEILPYKNIIGEKLYRIKKFEYDKYVLKNSNKSVEYKLKLALLMFRNIDITILKINHKIRLKVNQK